MHLRPAQCAAACARLPFNPAINKGPGSRCCNLLAVAPAGHRTSKRWSHTNCTGLGSKDTT